MPFLEVLCPNGHRVKVEVSPNTNLMKVLEEACTKKGFLPLEDYTLIYNRKQLDLSLAFRYSGLLNNAKLELVTTKDKHPLRDEQQNSGASQSTASVVIALRLEGGERLDWTGTPTASLWQILEEVAANNPNLAEKIIPPQPKDQHPVVVYLQEQIQGNVSLRATTLASLGLSGGRALLQLFHRAVDPEVLAAKEAAALHQGTPDLTHTSRANPQATISNEPEPSGSERPFVETAPLHSGMDTSPSSSDHPWSVFGQPNVGQSVFGPGRTEYSASLQQSKSKPKTLGEVLGIDLSSSSRSAPANRPAESTPDLLHFKFPEETEGKDIYRNEYADTYTSDSDGCDREEIVYSLEAGEKLQQPRVDEEDLPDDFFDVTEADLRKLISSYRQEKEQFDSQLMTQSMREATRAMMYARYQRCIIQFIFPDRIVLQAVFLPKETVHSLYTYVEKSLRNPALKFDLYTTPPRVVLNDRVKTLLQVNLLPMARVYVSFKLPEMEDTQISFLRRVLLHETGSSNAVKARQIVDKWMHEASAASNDTSHQLRPSSSTVTSGMRSEQHQLPSTSSGSGSAHSQQRSAAVPKWFKPA